MKILYIIFQVYDLGCRSFALLFDDIDPDLCLVDKMEFSSPAEAQVRVSNDVYTTFKDLKYLFFCPTGIFYSIDLSKRPSHTSMVEIFLGR